MVVLTEHSEDVDLYDKVKDYMLIFHDFYFFIYILRCYYYIKQVFEFKAVGFIFMVDEIITFLVDSHFFNIGTVVHYNLVT